MTYSIMINGHGNPTKKDDKRPYDASADAAQAEHEARQLVSSLQKAGHTIGSATVNGTSILDPASDEG